MNNGDRAVGCALVIVIIGLLVLAVGIATPKTHPPHQKPTQGKVEVTGMGDVREVEIDGCQYLVWIFDLNGTAHGTMVHKGNCTNHGDKEPEPPEKDEHPNKHSI